MSGGFEVFGFCTLGVGFQWGLATKVLGLRGLLVGCRRVSIFLCCIVCDLIVSLFRLGQG